MIGRPRINLVPCTLVACLATAAAAQVAPTGACALVNRSIPATVSVPASTASDTNAEPASAQSNLRIQLLSADRAEVIQSEKVQTGEVDLARLFPRLWETKSPQVVYAQLVMGEKKIGPATILIPMLPPRYAPRADRDGVPQFPRDDTKPGTAATGRSPSQLKAFSGYWLLTDKHALVETSRGNLEFRLRPDLAPNSVMNFRDLIAKGFYTNIPVHRIASLAGQPLPDIAQFGDPTGTGQGGPGYMIDLEPSTLRHDYGVLSYARTSDPNSAGSQLIICLSREGTSSLDGKYASFAQLVDGADTMRYLAKTSVNADGKPLEAPVVKSIRLVDAAPFGEGPEPLADPMKQVPAR